MEYTSPDTTPALSVRGLFAAIKLTAPEKRQVDAAKASQASVMEIIHAYEPDSKVTTYNTFSPAHRLMDDAEAAFVEAPTPESARALHDAAVFVRDVEHTFPKIDAACHTALARYSQSLANVAHAALGRAKELLDTEAKTHRAALTKGAQVFGDDEEIQVFDRRLAKTREHLNGELEAIARDPLMWLQYKDLSD